MPTNTPKTYDRTAMAQMATKLRSRKTRSQDPNVLALTSADAQAAGDRALKLSRQMDRVRGRRDSHGGPTTAEAAAIERISREQGIGR